MILFLVFLVDIGQWTANILPISINKKVCRSQTKVHVLVRANSVFDQCRPHNAIAMQICKRLILLNYITGSALNQLILLLLVTAQHIVNNAYFLKSMQLQCFPGNIVNFISEHVPWTSEKDGICQYKWKQNNMNDQLPILILSNWLIHTKKKKKCVSSGNDLKFIANACGISILTLLAFPYFYWREISERRMLVCNTYLR